MRKKLILSITAAAIIAFVFSFSSISADESEDYEKYARAVNYYNIGEYESALYILDQIQGYSTSQSYYEECQRLLEELEMPNDQTHDKVLNAFLQEGLIDEIPEATYQTGVRRQIPVYFYLAEQLTTLDLSSCSLDDISFIASFTNLEELILDDNNITDLSPITELHKLQRLSLSNNRIVDTAPLYALTELTYLNLSDNKIEDIDSLSNMKNMIELNISINEIEGIWVAKHMPNLTKLDASHNKIKYIRSLSDNKSLKELNLMDNDFESAAALGNIESLEVLMLGAYWIPYADDDVEGLEELMSLYGVRNESQFLEKELFIDDALCNLTNLREFTLVNGAITSIGFFKDLPKFESLILDDSKVYESPEVLNDLSKLKCLSINQTLFNANPSQPSGEPIKEISAIIKMTELTRLGINGCWCDDLSGLGQLTNLTYLDISCNYYDIEFLRHLDQLVHLNMRRANNVADFSPLQDLHNLEYLDLFASSFKHFEYIAHMDKMKYLDIGDSMINNIDGIGNMKDLEHLNLLTGEGAITDRVGNSDVPLFDSIEEQEEHIRNYHIDYPQLTLLKNLKYYRGSEFRDLEITHYDSITKTVWLDLGSDAVQEILDGASQIETLETLNLNVHLDRDFALKIPYMENLKVLNINFGLSYISDPEDFSYKPTATIDLSAFEGQSQLEYVHIRHKRGAFDYIDIFIDLPTLQGLENCENLRAIIINDATLSDISALKNCDKLEIVDFSNCNIEDISALENKHYMRNLNLMNNKIGDISVLENCYRMRNLRLSDNSISNQQIVYEMPLVEDVWID